MNNHNEIQAMRFSRTGYAVPSNIQSVTERQQNILIVEENQAIRELLIWVFIAGGYRHIMTSLEVRSLRDVDLLVIDVDCSKTWMKTTMSSFWERVKMASSPALIVLTCPCPPVKPDGFLVLAKPFHVQDLLHMAETVLNKQTHISLICTVDNRK